MVGPLKVKDIIPVKLFSEKKFDQKNQERKVGFGLGEVGVPDGLIGDIEVADQAEFFLVFKEMVDYSRKIT